MKKLLAALLFFCMLLAFCPAALAADWALPEGTPMFETGCVMELDFGTFTVLDAGFAKKVELFYSVTTRTSTRNGVSETHEDHNEIHYSAKDGTALFVVKGILKNTSDGTYNTQELHPEIQLGADSPILLDAFPAAPLSGGVAPPPGVRIDLEPGASVNIDFACTIEADDYHGNSDILFSFAGASLGFRKANLQSYVSIGFEEEDGAAAEDVTMLADKVFPAAAQQAEQEPQHFDELTVEAVMFEYDTRNHEYRMNVKVRNINYPAFEGRAVDDVRVNFRFLDKNGNAVPANRSNISGYGDLHPGQSGWGPYVMSGSGTTIAIDRATVDTAYSIVFNSYLISSTPDKDGRRLNIKGTITDPVVFILDDIIPGRVDAAVLAESDAVAVDNVTVDFAEELPSAITRSTAYRGGAGKFHYNLTDSETYAVIRFSITNMTTKDIRLSDTGGDFYVELNFNNGFIYSMHSSKACVMESGGDIAVMEWRGSSSSRVGDSISIAPLVTYDVTLYLPCAKLVATMTDKPLVVSFHTTQTGDKQIDVKVR